VWTIPEQISRSELREQCIDSSRPTNGKIQRQYELAGIKDSQRTGQLV
jgi:hypothetical protein